MWNAPAMPIRTLLVTFLVIVALVIGFTGIKSDAHDLLLPIFEWMETTLFGRIEKSWGATFAVAESFHLLAMALLGGAVLVSDARLLNLVFTDVPCAQVQDQAHRLFSWCLVIMLITGVFMACTVAMKIYYMDVFGFKMLALGVGILFVFGIRRPLLKGDIERLNPWVVRSVAVASTMTWFTVAAMGRWIGFSG